MAVTSFSPAGLELYGRDFLKSFLHHCDLRIAVYTEGKNEGLPKSKRISYRNLWDVPGCIEFVSAVPPATNNYRMDANRFSRKVFAQLDALDKGVDQLFWFDADIVLRGRLDEAKLSNFVKDVAVAYLGREGFHLCSSFVGYNTRNPDLPTYAERMRSLYLGGGIFDLPGFTDCDAMENAMRGLSTRNICAGNHRATGPANVFDMYFPGHHKKGSRKFGEKGG